MRQFSLLIKPAGPDCNIRCRYCFYLEKTCMFGQGQHRMSDEILDCFIRKYMELGFQNCSIAFQGGEPTLMGLDFFKKVVELEQKYGKDGQEVSNALQTNGTLLDDQWGRFLAENKFLTGVSLDGPEKYHDIYRLDAAGKGTFDRVMAGIEACRRNGAEFNILVLLNDKNVQAPDELWDFFMDLGIDFLQFVPCVEMDPETKEIAQFSVTPQQYGDFLCRIFDRWLKAGPEKVSIRIFDTLLSYVIQGHHTICTFGKRCNPYFVIEHNGDVFCCDFYVERRFQLGNILENSFEEMSKSEVKREFAGLKNQLAHKCFVCRYKDLCRGGCLKDRFVLGEGAAVPSYLCEGYKQFFDHAMPRLYEIATDYVAKLQSQNQNR